jgi:hypothetical protein
MSPSTASPTTRSIRSSVLLLKELLDIHTEVTNTSCKTLTVNLLQQISKEIAKVQAAAFFCMPQFPLPARSCVA